MTSRRKPPALQVHVTNEPSTSDDYIPISIKTLGVPAVTSCPSLQSRPHEENNLARSFSSANISALNEELLKLRSQRSRVKEMGAVNLFPSCDEISPSEPRSPFSPSLLWHTWYCVRLNMRYFDMDVIRFVYASVHQTVSHSVSPSFSQSVGESSVSLSVRTSIMCTILFEFDDYTDHFINREISSHH